MAAGAGMSVGSQAGITAAGQAAGGGLDLAGNLTGLAIAKQQYESYEPPFTGLAFDPYAQTPYALGQYWLASLMGLHDPSLLHQAGPLDSALARFRTTAYPSGAGRSGQERSQIRAESAKSYYTNYAKGREAGMTPEDAIDYMVAPVWPGMTREVLSYSGYNTIEEMFEAEYEHQQRVGELADIAEQVSGVSSDYIANAINQMSEIISDLPGTSAGEIGDLKAAELARINVELNEQAETAQRRANLGGYNPGREMEEIERRRGEADTVALQRALALIQGQQGVAGNALSLLQGGSGLYNNIALSGNMALAGSMPTMGPSQGLPPPSSLPQYAAGAGAAAGSGLANAALAYGAYGSQSPAYTPQTYLSPSSYDTLYGPYQFNSGNLLSG
jgi:hypothetical protein